MDQTECSVELDASVPTYPPGGLTPEMLEARQRPHIQKAIKECLLICAAHLEQRLAEEGEASKAA
jgi:hypothetical protein